MKDREVAVHPGVEELTAFGVGQLEQNEMELLAEHLASCPNCQVIADGETPDPLSALVRSVLIARSETGGLPPTEGWPEAWLLPELADHPRYRIVQKLGAGGMGVVYKAEHRLMRRTVALKVINQRVLSTAGVIERFRREVQAAARLSHPNIVTAYDADQAGDLHFLVMEFVEGMTLAQVVEKQGPLPPRTACAYVRQAAQGLQHAFERGLVHRDIKPHNLMLTPTGEVKVLDFGLAGFVSDRGPEGALTTFGQGFGTPGYMAPEQSRDAHTADSRADVYSLGCTLYFLLTGQPPGPTGQVPRPVEELCPRLPDGLGEVLRRMMAREASQRYQTPAEVIQALAGYAEGAGLAVAGPLKDKWLVGGLAATLLIALGISPWVLRLTSTPLPQGENGALQQQQPKTELGDNKDTPRTKDSQPGETGSTPGKNEDKKVTSDDAKEFLK